MADSFQCEIIFLLFEFFYGINWKEWIKCLEKIFISIGVADSSSFNRHLFFSFKMFEVLNLLDASSFF